MSIPVAVIALVHTKLIVYLAAVDTAEGETTLRMLLVDKILGLTVKLSMPVASICPLR